MFYIVDLCERVCSHKIWRYSKTAYPKYSININPLDSPLDSLHFQNWPVVVGHKWAAVGVVGNIGAAVADSIEAVADTAAAAVEVDNSSVGFAMERNL